MRLCLPASPKPRGEIPRAYRPPGGGQEGSARASVRPWAGGGPNARPLSPLDPPPPPSNWVGRAPPRPHLFFLTCSARGRACWVRIRHNRTWSGETWRSSPAEISCCPVVAEAYGLPGPAHPQTPAMNGCPPARKSPGG